MLLTSRTFGEAVLCLCAKAKEFIKVGRTCRGDLDNRMDILHEYVKLRSEFGRQCLFSDRQELLVDVPPNPKLASQFVIKETRDLGVQGCWEMSEHEVNTKRFEYDNQGINHVEGGWPKDINHLEMEQTIRFRKKVEKDEIYMNSVMVLGTVIGQCVGQNNAVDIYQEYFRDEDMLDEVQEAPSVKVANVYRDPHHVKRHVTCLSWQPNGGNHLAAAYCYLQTDKAHLGMSQESYIWDIENPTQPYVTLHSTSQLICLDYNPDDMHSIFSGCVNGQIALWDARNGKSPAARTPLEGCHTDPVYKIVWLPSPTGTEAFSASTDGQVGNPRGPSAGTSLPPVAPARRLFPTDPMVGLPAAEPAHGQAGPGPESEGKPGNGAGGHLSGVRPVHAGHLPGGDGTGGRGVLRQGGQERRRENRLHLRWPPRTRLRHPEEPLLFPKLPDGGRLGRPHLVAGRQGDGRHVDQAPGGLPDGRLLESRQTLRLLHRQDGRRTGHLGHLVQTERSHSIGQGARRSPVQHQRAPGRKQAGMRLSGGHRHAHRDQIGTFQPTAQRAGASGGDVGTRDQARKGPPGSERRGRRRRRRGRSQGVGPPIRARLPQRDGVRAEEEAMGISTTALPVGRRAGHSPDRQILPRQPASQTLARDLASNVARSLLLVHGSK
ncbi:uncharacterized protein LOC144210689 isoform X2 [Stigmatopora nigra]